LKPSIIAIDGPAASGKSTIGSIVAGKLGYLYFDTGVMYRAVTTDALDHAVPIENETAVTQRAESIRIDILPPNKDDGRDMTLYIDGRDCTWAIRRREVDQNVSPVSAYPGVRKAMVAEQRRIGKRGQIVMVGRDIGTVVFPEADLKIYLDASPEERARRRFVERKNRGELVEFETVLRELERRDAIDSTRSVAPLKQADDAVYLDSTGLDIEHVVARVLEIVAEREKAAA
jgi:CMP/dCMP kinase